VIWLTGFSGAGKTTVAHAIVDALTARRAAVELLDGDTLRAQFPDTGYSRAARDANVRRAGLMAARLEREGAVVVAALISPFADSRAFVRGLCRRFIEVHVATPLEACERRDTKGLYARARRGELAEFTGISSPYEPPEQPELRLDMSQWSVEDAVRQILAALDNAPA
jgi:adenylylsulfate kinase